MIDLRSNSLHIGDEIVPFLAEKDIPVREDMPVPQNYLPEANTTSSSTTTVPAATPSNQVR
jgi:hypothetical protein